MMRGTLVVSVTAGTWGAAACAPLAVWGVIQVALRVIEMVFAARYERVRAQHTVRILQHTNPGISVSDRRSDGTMLTVTHAADPVASSCDGEGAGAQAESRQ